MGVQVGGVGWEEARRGEGGCGGRGHPHSEHRFPAPSSKRKDVVNQCLESGGHQAVAIT